MIQRINLSIIYTNEPDSHKIYVICTWFGLIWSDLVWCGLMWACLLRALQTLTSFRKAARRTSWTLVSQVRSCRWCWWGIRAATGTDTFVSKRNRQSSSPCVSPATPTPAWLWTWAFMWQGQRAAYCSPSSARTGLSTRLPRVLQYRAEDVNVKHPADCRDIILFSFRKKNLFSKSKVSKHLDRFRYVRLSIKRSTPVITQPLIQRQCLDNRILSPESFRSHQTFGFASKFVCLYLHHKRFMLVLQNIWVCTDWFDLIEPLNKNLRVAVCRSSSCVSPPAPGLMPSLWTRWEVTAVFAVPPTTWTSW